MCGEGKDLADGYNSSLCSVLGRQTDHWNSVLTYYVLLTSVPKRRVYFVTSLDYTLTPLKPPLTHGPEYVVNMVLTTHPINNTYQVV